MSRKHFSAFRRFVASLTLVALLGGVATPAFADGASGADSSQTKGSSADKSSSSSPNDPVSPLPKKARYGHEIETRGRLGPFVAAFMLPIFYVLLIGYTSSDGNHPMNLTQLAYLSVFLAPIMAAFGALLDHAAVSDLRIDVKMDKLWKILLTECEKIDCRVTRVDSRWGHRTVPKVTFPDGWYVVFDRDPGVVEIRGQPLSSEQTTENVERMQNTAFDLAARAGLYPPRFLNLTNGGHVSIDFAVFDEDPLLFRNFLVDFMNHTELARGILLNDWYNAQALGFWKDQRRAFKAVIADFDSGKIKSAEDLARKFVYLVVNDERNVALNLKPALSDSKRNTNPEQRRLEIRSVRAQTSAKIWELTVRLFDSRIAYLKKLNRPIAYEDQRPSFNPITKLAAFRRYVTESGNDWNEFLPLLNWRYRALEATGKVCSFLTSPLVDRNPADSSQEEGQ